MLSSQQSGVVSKPVIIGGSLSGKVVEAVAATFTSSIFLTDKVHTTRRTRHTHDTTRHRTHDTHDTRDTRSRSPTCRGRCTRRENVNNDHGQLGLGRIGPPLPTPRPRSKGCRAMWPYRVGAHWWRASLPYPLIFYLCLKKNAFN